jgi:hypothetical protein
VNAEIPPFAIIPTRAIADRDLLESDLRVLAALCSFLNRETGRCFPSHPALKRRSGYSVPTVKRALARLRDRDYVHWTASYSPRGDRGSNEYTITDIPPWIIQGDLGVDHLTVSYPPAHPGRSRPRSPKVSYKQTTEQTTGTDLQNTAARLRERRIVKGKNPVDDVEVIDGA